MASTNAATTSESNCVPAHRCSSATASSTDRAGAYRRLEIIASKASATATISTRRYAPARSVDDAVAELQRCAGTQFDSEVVAAFVEAMTAREEQAAAVGGSREQKDADVAVSTESRLDHDAPRATTGIDLQRRRRPLERAWRAPAHGTGRAYSGGNDRRLCWRACAGARRLCPLRARASVAGADRNATRPTRARLRLDRGSSSRDEAQRRRPAADELAIAQSRLSFLVGLIPMPWRRPKRPSPWPTATSCRARIAARRGLSLVLGNTEQSERLRTNATSS